MTTTQSESEGEEDRRSGMRGLFCGEEVDDRGEDDRGCGDGGCFGGRGDGDLLSLVATIGVKILSVLSACLLIKKGPHLQRFAVFPTRITCRVE